MADRIIKHGPIKGRTSTASPPARPFQCKWPEGCLKSFNRKSDLQRHYRIHTNERPYACDYKDCEKTFIQRSALTVHRRTHTGDKPHKCPYINCGKCFSDSSSLARHRRIHTNDKPYICRNPQCRKAFCRKTTMTKHFRKEHPTESLDQDPEFETSDVEPSDDEPSLEQDDEDSPDSMEHIVGGIKSEGSRNPAARNYHIDLWRLPGQSAQTPSPSQAHFGPDVQGIKTERSVSRTPQRTPTDPPLHHGMVYATTQRANTMPISRSPSGDMAMWQAQSVQQSPTSMTHPQHYQMHDMQVPTSAPNQYQHQTMHLNRAIHDVILDDPQQPAYTQAPRQQAYAMPTTQYATQPTHDFRDEMPSTPAPGQQVPQFPGSLDATGAQYQPPQALPMEDYNSPVTGLYALPQSQAVPSYQNHMDPWKDVKLEDAWSQMPEPVGPWH